MSNELMREELDALQSIYNNKELHVAGSKVTFMSDAFPSDKSIIVKNGDEIICKSTYLPPVTFICTLPFDYPSNEPPEFSIECAWLSIQQLEEVAKSLNVIYLQNPNFPVLYTWMTFIQSEIPKTLNLNDGIDVSSLNDSETEFSSSNYHVSNNFTDLNDLRKMIVDYDIKRKQEKFDESTLECLICFQKFKGAECVHLGCPDTFCKSCFCNYLKSMIKDGRIMDITCAHCDLELTPKQIQSYVDEKYYNDFEKLTLNHALENMDDIEYCPALGCGCPVVIEKEESIGICPKCQFAFCAKCRKGFHGKQNPCATPDKKLSPVLRIKDLEPLVEEYKNSDKAHQSMLVKKYGTCLLDLVDGMLTAEEIENAFRKCPNCKVPIQKTGGCNLMYCRSCSSAFCWNCLQLLSDEDRYRHFITTSCSL